MNPLLTEIEEDQPRHSPEMDVPHGHEPLVCGPIMDDEDAQKAEYLRGYQDAARIAIDHWKLSIVAMLRFRGDPRMAILCVAIAHGFWNLVPHRDQVAIAAKFHCSRANVNKLTILIQKRLGLPPTIGQRSLRGRENMSDTRKEQLNH